MLRNDGIHHFNLTIEETKNHHFKAFQALFNQNLLKVLLFIDLTSCYQFLKDFQAIS